MSFIEQFFRKRPTPPAPIPSVDPLPPVPPQVPPLPDEPPPAPVTGTPTPILISPGPFVPRQYAYWANAFRSGDQVYVFAGDPRTGGPAFFSVHLPTGSVQPWDAPVFHRGETEGWEWTADGLIQLAEGPRLYRVNPFTGEETILFDISSQYPGHTLWQPHTSPSGRTVSATVKSPDYQKVLTVVWQGGMLRSFEPRGALDESALCGDDWLIIKEGDDNRIITLASGGQQVIPDAGRALGHSDCWPPYHVGEADKPDPGGCGVWDLRDLSFRFLFPTLNMGYISAKAGRYLHSDDTGLYLLNIETGDRTFLLDHGVRSSAYDDRVKANLDWTGTVAVYMVDGALYLLVL